MDSLLYCSLAGAVGALVKDVVVDNKIQLPEKPNGQILLGSVGGMIIGAFVGYVIDQSILMALLSGFVGLTAIENLLPKKTS